jgi:tetratricopeptide (TPR) repeat protein
MKLLLLPSLLLTLLLVLHSWKVRGGKTTFLFFVSCFLFGVVRGNSVAALAAGENGGPYIFSGATWSIGRAELPACVGWIFALYLSWCLAEAVVSRIPSLSGRVFPLSAFALLAMGCFSCAVETTASGVGWWRWNIVRPSTPILVGGTHFFGIVEWMSVAFDFLVPFLLFRTPRGGRLPAAWLSLLLYPIHWATHWKQVTAAGIPHSYEIYHAVISLSVLAFPFARTPLLAEQPTRGVAEWIRSLPWVAIGGMFVVLGWVDAGVLQEPELLLSVLPLGAFLALAIGGAVPGAAAGVAAAAVASAGSWAAGRALPDALARAIPSLAPLVCLLIFSERAGLVIRPKARRMALAGLVLLCLVTAGAMVRGKRQREEYSRLVDQARSLVSLGDAAGAETLLKQAVELKPNVNLGRMYLANLYVGQGRYDEAWAHVRRSLDLDPTDADAFREAGNIHRARERCREALPFYERAILLNPIDTETARHLGDCWLRLGRPDRAAEVLRPALAREPESSETGRLLATALLRSRRFPEAEPVVRRLLERNPGDASAHLMMAFLRAGEGDLAGARQECRRVLEISPGDEQATRLLQSLP